MKVGTRIDLEERLDQLKSKTVLLRAVNERELEQLQRDGSSRFKFNQWTNYEIKIGPYIEEFVRENGNGNVVLFIESEPGFVKKHFRGSEYLADPIYACLVDFVGPVEVYNFLE